MPFSTEHTARLEWLRGQRREAKSTANLLVVAENWMALLEKCADLIDMDAEIRGMECQRP